MSIFSCTIGNYNYKTPNVEGYCPKGWRRIGYICYKYKHRKGNLQRALKQCKRMQDKKEIHQTIKEDYSNLLTLSKLNEFHRDVTKMSKSIKKKIILNAFKYQGKWYEIHSLPRKLKHFKLQRLIGGSKNYSIFNVEFFHYYLPRYFCICIEKKTFAIN